MEEKRKIVAVFAHPDDETFICGGTLAHYAKQGVHITLICATKGEMGRRMGNPPFVNRETMPMLREQELIAACRELGILDLKFLEIRDKMVEFEDENILVQRIFSILDEVRPQVLLTFHEKLGGHPDHCAIGKAATLAFQKITSPKYKPSLYFIAFEEMLLEAGELGYTDKKIKVINVKDSLYEKMLASRAHRSQSELEAGLWQSDSEAIKSIRKQEYFLCDEKIDKSEKDSLFT
ncbi:PIG-L family deacetylase [Bacillus taeanensis]|uniref:LmbE family protein n=1 Tax=Bacillus taeanensis TaxID=273032 RepID=A0A366Y180_9BACI|nr:PIG-L family deacetylase [Bacillus taeanensis]RBW71125.1 LmbE family protein [Bacillus taeanensis]